MGGWLVRLVESGGKRPYGSGGVVKDAEWDDPNEVDGCDKGNWEEELAFLDGEVLFRSDGEHSILFNDVDFGFFGLFAHRRGDSGSWTAPATDPQSNCHNAKIDGHEHGAGEVGADADETVRLH